MMNIQWKQENFNNIAAVAFVVIGGGGPIEK